MDFSSTSKLSKPSFKQIVDQDHRQQPNPNDPSYSTRREKDCDSHQTATVVDNPNPLNIVEILAINDNHFTAISMFEKL